MAQISPRRLRLLRIEDSDVFSAIQDAAFPTEVVATIQRWSDFLCHLGNPDSLRCDLLAIDIRFNEDPSGPSIDEISIDEFNRRRYDPNLTPKELQKDPVLSSLVWSPVLRCFGKNTGIVMGSLLAGYCLNRDLPVGVGVHTGFPRLPACDVTTAMLLTQILVASGAFADINDDQKILREAVESLTGGHFRRRLEDVLPEMLERFRSAFRHRAGKGQYILVEQESLDQLMAIFHSVASEEDLDKSLSLYGIRFYDREGREDCLDVRSIFADMVLDKALSGCPPRLSLDTVRFPTHAKDSGGKIYQFVHSLYSGELSYIGPIIEFFKKYKDGEERHAFAKFTRPMSKIIALLFAWCHVQAETLYEETPWDPMTNEPAAPEKTFPSRLAQVQAIHHILTHMKDEETVLFHMKDKETRKWAEFDPQAAHVPLSLNGQLSIMGAISRYCTSGHGDSSDELYEPLRYDQPNNPNLSGQRQTAVLHLLEDLVRSKHLDEVNRNGVKWFKVMNDTRPRHIYPSTDNRRILEVLGLNPTHPHKTFERILEKSPISEFGNVTPADFFDHLENDRLPSRFAKLCQHFMRTIWKEVPESAWPPCIRDMPSRAVSGGTDPAPNEGPGTGKRNELNLRIQRELWGKLMPPEGSSPCKALYYRVQQAEGDVGGDLVRIPTSAQGALSLIFLDSPGKGYPAMNIGIRQATIMDDFKEAYDDPQKMFSILNARSTTGIEIPFVHVVISPDRQTMKYINAGHESPLLLRGDRSQTWLESTTGRLGLSAQQAANERTVALYPGDRIIVYSGGLSKAANIDGIPFGRQRIADTGATNVNLKAQEMTDAILDEARSFCCDCPWEDDVTLAVIAL